MSKFYNLIESQVNLLARLIMEDDQGNVNWAFWNSYVKPKNMRFVINVIASLLYLALLMSVGVYLWNQGIHVMMPSIIQPLGFGKSYQQSQNPYFQLLITLFAMMMLA